MQNTEPSFMPFVFFFLCVHVVCLHDLVSVCLNLCPFFPFLFMSICKSVYGVFDRKPTCDNCANCNVLHLKHLFDMRKETQK